MKEKRRNIDPSIACRFVADLDDVKIRVFAHRENRRNTGLNERFERIPIPLTSDTSLYDRFMAIIELALLHALEEEMEAGNTIRSYREDDAKK
ncbi:hypothetical protein L1987_75275 [Smallanthus sonchifolius]|uniref:Uncharacterized protein n=1 Tax=Smallanthus sonchifolius TaxID=185202 RepID=A0ACB9A488_9ASTR|nr:hypothetical protein L1987_75275 [Smallanthus sonchifolius]